MRKPLNYYNSIMTISSREFQMRNALRSLIDVNDDLIRLQFYLRNQCSREPIDYNQRCTKNSLLHKIYCKFGYWARRLPKIYMLNFSLIPTYYEENDYLRDALSFAREKYNIPKYNCLCLKNKPIKKTKSSENSSDSSNDNIETAIDCCGVAQNDDLCEKSFPTNSENTEKIIPREIQTMDKSSQVSSSNHDDLCQSQICTQSESKNESVNVMEMSTDYGTQIDCQINENFMDLDNKMEKTTDNTIEDRNKIRSVKYSENGDSYEKSGDGIGKISEDYQSQTSEEIKSNGKSCDNEILEKGEELKIKMEREEESVNEAKQLEKNRNEKCKDEFIEIDNIQINIETSENEREIYNVKFKDNEEIRKIGQFKKRSKEVVEKNESDISSIGKIMNCVDKCCICKMKEKIERNDSMLTSCSSYSVSTNDSKCTMESSDSNKPPIWKRKERNLVDKYRSEAKRYAIKYRKYLSKYFNAKLKEKKRYNDIESIEDILSKKWKIKAEKPSTFTKNQKKLMNIFTGKNYKNAVSCQNTVKKSCLFPKHNFPNGLTSVESYISKNIQYSHHQCNRRRHTYRTHHSIHSHPNNTAIVFPTPILEPPNCVRSITKLLKVLAPI